VRGPAMKGLKTGGRQIGALNKTTNEVRKLTQEYGQEAIEVLVTIMRTAESEAVKISAVRELLDRAYGKPQPVIEARSEEHKVNVITLIGGVREEVNSNKNVISNT
jgi:N-methylhydantoinase B/oxoprolinase/acetone carboxylase alpha subunit